jgi:RNA polymerase sigma factor (sigma-70 family)
MSKTDPLNRKPFLSTHWSVVNAAAGGSDDALAELCAAYWQPLYWHVRRMGYNACDAQDLIQSFFARLLEKRLVAQADRQRGRFRTFLLTALRRFVINEWKRGRTVQAGGQARVLPLAFASAENEMSLEPSHNLTPDALFERQWAIQVLQHSLARLEQQQRQAGKGELFDRLVPYLTMCGEPPGYEALAAEFALTTAALKMTVSRWRKELGRLLREEIRNTVLSDEEVDEELSHLMKAVSA